MEFAWDEEVAALLYELSSVQEELLELLVEKQRLLTQGDPQQMAATQPRETRIVERLQQCQQQRQELLDRAGREGLPCRSVQALTAALPAAARNELAPQLRDSKARGRLLAHQSLTNWVIAQRTLIHVAQLLEIIATGGRLAPTYGQAASRGTGGALVDQAV